MADLYVLSEGEIKGSVLVAEAVPGGPCVVIYNMHERFGHGIERGQQTCEHKVCDLKAYYVFARGRVGCNVATPQLRYGNR